MNGLLPSLAARVGWRQSGRHSELRGTDTVPKSCDGTKKDIAISLAEVLHIKDGGDSWHSRNRATFADFLPVKFPDSGQCFRGLLPTFDGKRLY
jgi:hypothetical protein